MPLPKTLLTLASAAVAIAWTAAGESSDPVLSATELPAAVAAEACRARADERNACLAAAPSSRWISRTARGHLFLVRAADCGGAGDCPAWLVEKRAHEAVTLLALHGEFELSVGTRAYPDVRVRVALAADEIAALRYQWDGGGYRRVELRHLYEVDGTRCGTREQCAVEAEAARRAERLDRAVRIYERVHGVAWI